MPRLSCGRRVHVQMEAGMFSGRYGAIGGVLSETHEKRLKLVQTRFFVVTFYLLLLRSKQPIMHPGP